MGLYCFTGVLPVSNRTDHFVELFSQEKKLGSLLHLTGFKISLKAILRAEPHRAQQLL